MVSHYAFLQYPYKYDQPTQNASQLTHKVPPINAFTCYTNESSEELGYVVR